MHTFHFTAKLTVGKHGSMVCSQLEHARLKNYVKQEMICSSAQP